MTWASVARLDLLGSESALAVEECAVEPEEVDFSREKWAPCRSLEWGMQTRLRILDFAPLADARDDYLVISPLAAYSADWPTLSMQCLHKLAFAKQGCPEWLMRTAAAWYRWLERFDSRPP